MQKISPCLWFDKEAEEAARYYVSVFGDGTIKAVTKYGKDMPMPEGTVLTVEFELFGKDFLALNGGPNFKFTEAISMSVLCKNQEEIDRYWDKLTTNGGEESQCGWLKDKYGMSWQITPEMMADRLKNGDPVKVYKMMQAMMTMKKLDIEKLDAAYNS